MAATGPSRYLDTTRRHTIRYAALSDFAAATRMLEHFALAAEILLQMPIGRRAGDYYGCRFRIDCGLAGHCTARLHATFATVARFQLAAERKPTAVRRKVARYSRLHRLLKPLSLRSFYRRRQVDDAADEPITVDEDWLACSLSRLGTPRAPPPARSYRCQHGRVPGHRISFI